jgi:hypothetical protein
MFSISVRIFLKFIRISEVSALEEIALGENERAFFISYHTEELDISKFTVFENPPVEKKHYLFNDL